MNKRSFTFIMSLMGVSIIAIIIIQMVWIDNAITVRNDLVEKTITDALTHSVKEIDDLRDRIPIEANFNFNDFRFRDNSSKRQSPFNDDRGGDRIENNIPNDRFEGNHTDSLSFSGIEPTQENQSLQDSIIERVSVMYESSTAKIDSLSNLLHEFQINTPQMEEQFNLQREAYGDIFTQMYAEISNLYSNLITLDDIKNVVRESLDERNIPLEFDIALFKNDSIISISNNADSLALRNSKFRTRIFSNNRIDRNQSLAIFLPNQGDIVFRSVHWLLFASFVFSLIVLLTFGLSVFFMLRQKKISEMKSDFINNMTHEFKTPIATISVAADTISNSKVITQPDKINYFVEMIKKENTRMNRQVEDILAIARLDKKDFDFNWEPFNVHDTIEDVVESIVLQVEKRGGTITSKLEAKNPTITSDKTHCSNVIYNLLDNANKYSPEKPEITLKTKNTTNGIIISVEDHGIGMSKSVQSKIFEKFYRQTTGNIHNVKGFGLGLSYIKAVIEANKGTITVYSELGKGSRFEVFLPFTREN